MEYSVYGEMRLGRNKKNFRKNVDAPSEKAAREKVFSLLGSQNGLQRSMIKINKIEKS
jgi:large subunit ribosomal protein LX